MELIAPQTVNEQEMATNLRFASLFTSRGGKASRSARGVLLYPFKAQTAVKTLGNGRKSRR